MAHVTGDRVLETTTTTGTGTITLAGAVSGYRAFSAVATLDNDTFYYTIALGTEWEVGLGTRASSTTFTRTTVIASSNAGSAVNFSAGTKECWMDIPARLVKLFTPSPNPNLINGWLAESHAGNAVTFSIKTLANNDPSAADPVFFVFSGSDGITYNVIRTSALSITVASGATLGVIGAKCPRIWLAALYVAGAVELAVRNCHDGTTGFKWFPTCDNRITTTVQAGDADDLALVTYSAVARTDVPFVVLGHCVYDTSLATPGTWAISPSYFILHSPQTPKTGDVLQTIVATSDVTTNATGNSTFVDTNVAVTITPMSFANAIRIRAHGGTIEMDEATSVIEFRLRNTTQGATVGPAFQGETWNTGLGGNRGYPGPTLYGVEKPVATTAQTYKVQFYDVATSGTFAQYPEGDSATIVAEEIMT